MKSMKRVFSLLLAMVMLLSPLSASGFAADVSSRPADAAVYSGEDHNYLSRFSCERSVLAPGITQEINMAITADGKQMRYYIATADLSSEYVSVYANYNNNDPAAGWALSRVRDQANAAQAKHSDPDSEDYIPNYTVVAAINGAGYNMSTGEPGGLLVMGGVEYHAPDGAGFFGILKDGSAYIGTTAEYNELKAQGLVMEGIAGFGTFLIVDGEIVVSHSDSHVNARHSRTAVGITAKGEVVFMVLDGRQEPVSCGGSYQEIAQIMKEAGCVQAVNLDGGGSTTFVAKQEGENELSLINNPSDGFERSVSTSLIMVSTAPVSNEFDHAVISAENSYMTVGVSMQLSAAGVSVMGSAAELPEGCSWALSDSSIGSIDANGLFTAAAVGDVEAQLLCGGEIVGSLELHVVQPDTLSFTKDCLDSLYGQAVELPLVLSYEGNEVAFDPADIILSLSNESAGTVSGLSFVGDEASGVKKLELSASLKTRSAGSDSIAINLYSGSIPFDFENATGGVRALAWQRSISNTIMDNELDENISYRIVDLNQPMVSSYTIGFDLAEMPMSAALAAKLEELLGREVEAGESAWKLLLGLADKIDANTQLKLSFRYDGNFIPDVSALSLNSALFTLAAAELSGSNELTLTLKWKGSAAALDYESIASVCSISGIKLTPKADAAWNELSRLTVTNSAQIGYTIYVGGEAVYSFAQDSANQEAYGLQPFAFEGGAQGAYFGRDCGSFSDSYTMVNALKNGWFNEDAGYAYYVDGVKLTGIQQVEGYYYDFGEDGLNVGKTKFTGLFQIDGVNHYALLGLLSTGWVSIGEDSYCFDENGAAYDGTVVLDEVEIIFDNGLLVGGYSGFITKSDGETYHYINGKQSFSWYFCEEDGYWYHFDPDKGVMTTGTKVLPDAEARSKNAYYDFAEDGKLLRAYFNPAGYYYWAGLPKTHSWVKNGYDPDPEAWYRTNSHGHYVTDPSGNYTFPLTVDGVDYTAVEINVDGVQYTFNNANGKLLLGDVVSRDGNIYYYWAGEPMADGWFTVNGETRYAYPDGSLARGTVAIDGTTYEFDSDGVLLSEGGDIWAVVDEEGILTITFRKDNANSVRFAVWGSEAGQSESLVWKKASLNADGLWEASLPMCSFAIEDVFIIHAYTTAVGVGGVGAGTPQAELRIYVPLVEHTYDDDYDLDCNVCGEERVIEKVGMFRMYNPNSGEHFYTGSEVERDNLVAIGWHYEGVAFHFPVIGLPVWRLFNPVSGDHLYTMDADEVEKLLAEGWNYENIAFNSADPETGVAQYRLWNPNARRGAWHFTGSEEERDWLISLGWQYQGIGWWSILGHADE